MGLGVASARGIFLVERARGTRTELPKLGCKWVWNGWVRHLGRVWDYCTHPYQVANLGSGSGSPIGAEPENKHQLAGGPYPSSVGPGSCPRALVPCTSGYQPGEEGMEGQESSPWQPSPYHWSMQHPPNYRLRNVPNAIGTAALLL